MPTVPAPFAATVAHLAVAEGDAVEAGAALLFLEVMKMEQPVTAPAPGVVQRLLVATGDAVRAGQPLLVLADAPSRAASPPAEGTDADADEGADAGTGADADHDPDADPTPGESPGDEQDGIRPDLAEVLRRRALLTDEARPDAVARRRERGLRTARENVAALVDPGSFSEYGGLAIAAQRGRRSVEELLARTPADGLITGTATVNADLVGPDRARVAVAAYDATVLAGTQGHANHRKKDRLFRLALEHRLPVVLFAEGGGGRPGDTDVVGGSWLDVEAFRHFARLSGRVPLLAVVAGRCFAGNAALAGTCDLIIGVEGASLGMAGPAMIEGGGLGVVDPDDIGPMDVQTANGVVDVLVGDEVEAAAVARQLLSYAQGPTPAPAEVADQTALRDAVPANRRRAYDVRAIAATLADPGSLVELRRAHAPGVVTALARIGGRPVGILANDPTSLGGAVDAEAADSAVRHLELCDGYGLPVVVLCDTPGFMVGPEAERDGGVRRFSRLFAVGARLRVPLLGVVTRKAYGLGAMAMLGGDLWAPAITLAWPTAELGPMGLEGAVRLGFRRELDAIADPGERAEREQQLIDLAYAGAAGLHVATFGEVDDVIDPADTRTRLLQALEAAAVPAPSWRGA